jgi:hypothetical protein
MEALKQSLLRVKNLAYQLEIILQQIKKDSQCEYLSRNRQPGYYQENAIYHYIGNILQRVAEGQSPKLPLFYYDHSPEFDCAELENLLKLKLEQAKLLEFQYIENNKKFMQVTITDIGSLYKAR